MKRSVNANVPYHGVSRPSRGAWIETTTTPQDWQALLGRAPRGARGLKLYKEALCVFGLGRAPRGARGLKLTHCCDPEMDRAVAPLAGRVD